MKKCVLATVSLLWTSSRKVCIILTSVLFSFAFLFSCDNNENLQLYPGSSARLNQSDSLAIIAIYNEIGPFENEWDLYDTDTWKEVELSYDKNTREYRVVGFKSDKGSHKGDFPVEFCRLTELKYLEISGGKLKGSIPEEIGNLTKLETLKIRYNGMTGPIPAGIGNLKNLKSLMLVNNYISGQLPEEIANLTELTQLSISDTKVSGEIPTYLAKLTKLKDLNMFSNDFEGTFPIEICRIKLNMDFSGNNISRLPDEVWSDPEVKYIPNLQYNRIFHAFPDWVKSTELWGKYSYRVSGQQEN